MSRKLRLFRGPLLPALTLAFLGAGGLAWAGVLPVSPTPLLMAGLILTGAPLVLRSMAGVLRGHFAADLVATLAIITAVLLVEPLAGLVVVLMQTGGEALERYAEGRASRAVRELEAAAPTRAHRISGGVVEEVAARDLRPGDVVLVRAGEFVPCDGVVEAGESLVDASALTGEPLPVRAVPGAELLSGSVNGEGALHVRATRTSAESRYARIVELVRTAQQSKSPIQRVADRYAVWFTPLTLLVCAVAYAASQDPVRVLAVLVVATPCPLILATPVAIIGGINRAARRQIIVRDGGGLERLASIDTAAFDKTGTLTLGLPRLSDVHVLSAAGDVGTSFDDASVELLARAASLEQASSHPLGRAVVDAARSRGLVLETPSSVRERAGRGISGNVAGRDITIGARSLVAELYPSLADDLPAADGDGLRAWIVEDGTLAGMLLFDELPRSGIADLMAGLRDLGVRRTLLLSGDRTTQVAAIARHVGITEVHGDLMPEDKVRIVNDLMRSGHRVLMVGDGVNDAPALSAATVGVAMAGHGGGITAEAAHIVVLVDDPDRVVEAVRTARGTMRIARQSIGVGLGLSFAAMIFAAAGYIPPTAGALLQEGIDVAVIFNALRAAAPPRRTSRQTPR